MHEERSKLSLQVRVLHAQPSSTVSHVLAGPNTGLIVSTRAPGEPSHAVIEPECEIRPFVNRICPTGISRCRVTCYHSGRSAILYAVA